jgi:hypothetical protein
MTSQQPTTPLVYFYIAIFTSGSSALQAEELLSQLCADGDVDVLDGALIDWPKNSRVPLRRPLRNLPRLSALPEHLWDSWANQLGSGRVVGLADGTVPLPRVALLPGSTTVVTFCTFAEDQWRAERRRHVQAVVMSVALTQGQYTALRHTHPTHRDPAA